MRTTLICMAIGSSLLLSVTLAPADTGPEKPTVIDVFPGKPPGAKSEPKEDKVKGNKPSRSVQEVTKPSLTVFRPAKDKDTGVAIIIAPGGGYSNLAWDHEGEDVATWLNSLGVSGFVLRYRVPMVKNVQRDSVSFPPHQDAQRAISLVRSKAKELGINPKKIGMLGFSAGGHLTALTSTNFDKRGYDAIDDVDKVSCRPDFSVLVYPAYLTQGEKLGAIFTLNKQSPPMCFIHASDDMYTAEGSALMYLGLKRAGVPAEMHIYAKGGHGFGMRTGKQPVNQWPKRCEEWMRSQGILAASGAP
ncbi:MAG TPA: alpha/beta hydrolase [Gemmataceae bacterium]|nr:alpha/beta hydrolase [Gemmataceae bacterium]